MNPIIEIIRKRRSVRVYDPKPVPRDILVTLLEAGNAAPSGFNAQQWRFVVVQDAGFSKKLEKLALVRYKKWLESAPEDLKEKRKERDAQTDDPVYYSAPIKVFVIGSGMTADLDCPMVCQNIMLTARSLGIGSCWVYFGQLVIDDPEVKAALELKTGEKVFGPIILGYPKEGFPEAPPKKAVEVKWI